MNLYSFSSYKRVHLYIDCELGMKMFDEGHPVYFDSVDDQGLDLFFYIVGTLVFTEMIEKDKIHIMPSYANSSFNKKNNKMKIYSFNKNDVIRITGYYEAP